MVGVFLGLLFFILFFLWGFFLFMFIIYFFLIIHPGLVNIFIFDYIGWLRGADGAVTDGAGVCFGLSVPA